MAVQACLFAFERPVNAKKERGMCQFPFRPAVGNIDKVTIWYGENGEILKICDNGDDKTIREYIYSPKGRRLAEWTVWWMEMVWFLGAFAALVATYRRFRFSNLAYGIVFIWLMMHTVGVHYTFEHVPMDWLKGLLGTERNHYDRIDFCIGLNSCLLAELVLRWRWVANCRVAVVVGVFGIMAMAAGWEIIEWIVAVQDGGEDGLEFLGSQGDIWDVQKDMLSDTLGAIFAAVFFLFHPFQAKSSCRLKTFPHRRCFWYNMWRGRGSRGNPPRGASVQTERHT